MVSSSSSSSLLLLLLLLLLNSRAMYLRLRVSEALLSVSWNHRPP